MTNTPELNDFLSHVREWAEADSTYRKEWIDEKQAPLIQQRNELQDQRDAVLEAENYKLADVLDTRIDQVIDQIEAIPAMFRQRLEMQS